MFSRGRLLVTGVIVLLTLAYCFALVWDTPAWVRGVPGEWEWWRVPAPLSWRWLIPSAALVAWLAWSVVFLRTHRAATRVVLASAVLMTGLLPYFTLAVRDHPLRLMTQAVAAADTGSYFGVAARIDDPKEFLVQYAAELGRYPEIHMRTSPPGIPLLFWGARQAFEALPRLAEAVGGTLARVGCNPNFEGQSLAAISSATVQLALPFIAGLGLLPLYALALDWYGKRAALSLAAAYPLIPGLSGFAPSVSLLFLTLGATSLWLTWRAFRRGKWWLYAANGLLLSFATFLSFGNLVFLAFDVLLVLLWQVLQVGGRRSWRETMVGGLVMAAGMATLWVIYWAGWGVSGLDIYRIATASHGTLERSYLTWVFYNPYDVLSWTGIALVAPFVALLFSHRGQDTVQGRRRYAFAAGLLLFALALNLSGMVLGETARIALFLLPLFLLPGIASAVRYGRRLETVLLTAMATQVFVATIFLWPILTDWRHNPDWQRLNYVPLQYTLPAGVSPADFTLLNAFRLEGYTVTQGEGGEGMVVLYWRSLRRLSESYTVFVHALDEDGTQIGGHDSQPLGNLLPTFCWSPGELITDPHPIKLGPNVRTIVAGMYYLPTMQRLPVEPAQPNDLILLNN